MNLLESILSAQDGLAGQQLARQFGLTESQVSSALAAVVPALALGFQKNVSSPQGLETVISALGGGQHHRYVDDASTLSRADTIAEGNAILGQVFGSKEISRQVVSRAASQTGISEGVLKGMLPVVAAMMMGTMSKQLSPSAPQAGVRGQRETLLGMLTPMLDANRDGSIVDDVVGFIRRFNGR